jgi:methyl-accepting chemotaxis protein
LAGSSHYTRALSASQFLEGPAELTHSATARGHNSRMRTDMSKRMILRTKILAIAVGSVAVTAATGLLIQRSVIRRQGIELTRDTMREAILSAENARNSIAALRGAGAFDEAKLAADLAKVSDYKQAKLYQTVPVVAAWNSIAQVAAKEKYEFRVSARSPRNLNNTPRPDEEKILKAIDEGNLPEYFAVDESANQIDYARPIELSADCLICHGDATNSPAHNGKDILGFRMEGWRAGDRHGMFLLRSDLSRIDQQARAGMEQTALWLIPLSLCIGAGVYLLISKLNTKLGRLIQSISDGSDQVATAVSHIAAASQTLAQGATEQAASLQETSASSVEIATITHKSAEDSQLAAIEMESVNHKVQDSHVALHEMLTAMDDIKTSSHDIEKIVKVIDGIAFQTNILALNAAVEAARVGAAGAGFAVVAEEVRNLAQRSAAAAKDTAPLIEQSIAKCGKGSAKLEQVVERIQAITESASKAKVLVDEVNSAAKKQVAAIGKVSKAMLEMETVTHSNAASAEESAAASEQLAAQAQAMDQIAHELRVVVGR